MFRHATLLIAALIPVLAFADARIEIDQNGIDTFHAPFDSLNTDNETKSMPQAASSVQNDTQNVYYGDAMTEVTLSQSALRTIFLSYGANVAPVVITHEDAGEYGVLRVDGTTYRCYRWEAIHTPVDFEIGSRIPSIPKYGKVNVQVSLTNCQ